MVIVLFVVKFLYFDVEMSRKREQKVWQDRLRGWGAERTEDIWAYPAELLCLHSSNISSDLEHWSHDRLQLNPRRPKMALAAR